MTRRTAPARRTVGSRRTARTLPLHAVLVAVGALMVLPLLYAVLSGFKSTGELSRNPFGLPGRWRTGNYTGILGSGDFWRLLGNSTLIAVATTVLVVASIAPAIALAARLLLEPLARDATGKAIIDLTVLQERALPPGILAVAAYIAIELASAGMRRGAVLGIAASLIAVAIVGGAAVAVLQLTGTTLPRIS